MTTFLAIVGGWTVGTAIAVPAIHAICRYLNHKENQ